MKKRVIWKMLVLTIVTLGIYRLYWFIKTRREILNLRPDIKILSPIFLFIPIILVVGALGVFMVSTFQTYKITGNEPAHCQLAYNNNVGSNISTQTYSASECPHATSSSAWGIGLLYLSIFLFYPLMVLWLWGYSKGVEAITGNHTTFAIALLILLLVPDGIDILIIQDGFNKLADAAPTPTSSAAPTPIAA